VRRRLTRASDLTAWRTWRKGPVVVVDNFVRIDRGDVIARGDIVIRPWALRLVGCSWIGKQIRFPARATGAVITFENKEIERRFSRAALAAFRTAAEKASRPSVPTSVPPALPIHDIDIEGDPPMTSPFASSIRMPAFEGSSRRGRR
jgi:hypothetical protein